MKIHTAGKSNGTHGAKVERNIYMHGNQIQVCLVTFLWTPYEVLRCEMAIHCVRVEFTFLVVECICWECKVWLSVFTFAEKG